MGRAAELALRERADALEGRVKVLEARLKIVIGEANDCGRMHDTVRSLLRGRAFRWAQGVTSWALRSRDKAKRGWIWRVRLSRWLGAPFPAGYLDAKAAQRDQELGGALRAACDCGARWWWRPGDRHACPQCGRHWSAQSPADEAARRLEGRG
jgi:hypothetical protein